MSDPDLARRLLDCPRFRYMPGMLDIYGRRIIRVDGDKLIVAWYGNPHHRLAPDITVIGTADFPLDLDDDATVGCLLALVREAHHSLASTEYLGDDGWRWCAFRGPTEPAALVAALEAVP